jgi:hypothetical protein
MDYMMSLLTRGAVLRFFAPFQQTNPFLPADAFNSRNERLLYSGANFTGTI